MSPALRRIVRFAVAAAGLAAVALAALAGYLVFVFDPNDHLPSLMRLVQERYQRALRFDGPVSLKLFPILALEAGPVSLSEPGSGAEFVRVERLRARVRLRPLLDRRLAVDGVELAGARIRVTRKPDGRFNFDDLLSRESALPLEVEIQRLAVTDSALEYRDEKTGARLRADGLAISTGPLRDGTPSSVEIAGRVGGNGADFVGRARGELTFVQRERRTELRKLAVEASGSVGGTGPLALRVEGDASARSGELRATNLRAAVSGSSGGARFDATIAAPELALAGERVAIPGASAELRLDAGGARLRAVLALERIAGTAGDFGAARIAATLDASAGGNTVAAQLGGPLAGGIGADGVRLRSDEMALRLDARAKALRIEGELAGLVSWTGSGLELPRLRGKLVASGAPLRSQGIGAELAGAGRIDPGTGQARLRLAGRIADSKAELRVELDRRSPRLKFVGRIDRLDLDRLLAPGSPPSKADESPLDMLKTLDADGALAVGTVKSGDTILSGVVVELKPDRAPAR